MSESRHELVAWLNQLTNLNITKVEECGKGYVYAHVFDSIYGGVPFRKINFNCNNEYQYLQNWRVIQCIFTQHKIDKVIYVDRLVKCKFQDNLEFLQWVKKFWDQHFSGAEYDAIGRRGGKIASSSGYSVGSSALHEQSSRKVSTVSTTSTRISSNPSVAFLNSQIQTLQENAAGLEKERDFYFNKLRDIEILVQSAIDADPSAAQNEESLLRQIQNILYSIEEGFEVPDLNGDEIKQMNNLEIEDDTF
ncbi:hypothetical protein T552_00117 [Pneumocystis carinii B80]|uniref:EB1 C-terminal domain-containing protein n=1 Tax=Pneumocystis carinii (strain B80) TaxID=1408658 RepID=A0A0W4ZSX9_PNEC8|nr:hypothetical protein T552_00117 [Pneumocystis carinii B80]KTW31474.1 hypothetical protein T552_00117 [Pneumocystis carinii B80]